MTEDETQASGVPDPIEPRVPFEVEATGSFSRRQVLTEALKNSAYVAPIVVTIAAPTAAFAQPGPSCKPLQSPCADVSECCIGANDVLCDDDGGGNPPLMCRIKNKKTTCAVAADCCRASNSCDAMGKCSG